MTNLASSGDMIADSRYAYARAAAEGDWRAAADVLEQALERAPAWASAWFALGEARSKLLESNEAATAFRAALAADPVDTLGAANHLALLSGATPLRAPPAYVTRLFDDYAHRFDDHLVAELGYRGPALLAQALTDVAGERRFSTCLDLGCGTGLAGAAMRSRVDILCGVDLSPAMIAKARGKHVYDRLATGDLVAFLDACPRGGADLVIAADVLIYFGDLGAVFRGVSAALGPGGLFAFTLETHEGDGPRLSDRLRVAHAPAGVVTEAREAGLVRWAMSEGSVRQETGAAVAGMIGIFERE
jgi:predicted TPR repeat methyltransferase